ncbi:MAG: hypothetical protein IJI57_11645 [Flexilinea sp.]|nr:hypothetical protein [Flexilinea sp.]
MFIFFLCLSLAVFTVGVAYAVRMKMEDRIPWQSFLLIFLLVTAIAMWIAVLPLVKDGPFPYQPLYAAFYVLESAVGNVDYSLFSNALERFPVWRIYTIILHPLLRNSGFSLDFIINIRIIRVFIFPDVACKATFWITTH